MKFYILKAVAEYLQQFHTIRYIKRVDNNTLKIEFNQKNIIYIDLTKGDSKIYKKKHHDNIKKEFKAPFDIILQKKFTNSKISKIYLLNDDKILNIEISSKSSYKIEKLTLQLEFTGKYTNGIILDKDGIILEALRHIDEFSSTRVVQVGVKLASLPKPSFQFEEKTIDDIEKFLYDIYEKKEQNELQNIKTQKLKDIKKQIKKLQNILDKLEDIDSLEKKATLYNEEALDIVSSLYKYNGYEKEIRKQKSNELFTKSKKYKQKALHQNIQQQNLEEKLKFLYRLETLIKNSTNIDEIEFYMPKKDKNQKKTKKDTPYQSFFIDGYKIMLGRYEKENIYLLENARASDFWFHLQGQPSSHLLVPTKKKTLPPHIIEEAAKICAKFSTTSGGVYNVDFTQRRNVKIQNRANVLYNPYSTITIKI